LGIATKSWSQGSAAGNKAAQLRALAGSANAPKQDVTNSFSKKEGVIHIGGIDALVRLTLDQVRTDARRSAVTRRKPGRER
jgi:hypothetical protein